jgi:hypothetical protein
VKAAYALDQSVNITTAPASWKDQCKPVMRDGKIVDWIIPAGAVVEGEEALLRVATGQAYPVDEECAKACGISPSELAVKQRQYLAATRGIRGKDDLELFMAEVIEGYDKGTTETNTVYKPGKNWSKWQQAKEQIASKQDAI